MIEIAADIGATLAVLGSAAWSYRVIKDDAYSWANGPNARRGIRRARMLPAHWAMAAVCALILAGVWS